MIDMPKEIWVVPNNQYDETGVHHAVEEKTEGYEPYTLTSQHTAEVERLESEVELLRGALNEIAGHGVSQPAAMNMPEERWAWRCFNNLQYIARQALTQANGGE